MLGSTAPDAIDCARMRSLQISNKGDGEACVDFSLAFRGPGLPLALGWRSQPRRNLGRFKSGRRELNLRRRPRRNFCPPTGSGPRAAVARDFAPRSGRNRRSRSALHASLHLTEPLHAFEPMREALEPIIANVWRHCLATVRGRTLTLKAKFADFQQTFSISPEASPSAAPSTVARTLSI